MLINVQGAEIYEVTEIQQVGTQDDGSINYFVIDIPVEVDNTEVLELFDTFTPNAVSCVYTYDEVRIQNLLNTAAGF
jgi:hypothetical protein